MKPPTMTIFESPLHYTRHISTLLRCAQYDVTLSVTRRYDPESSGKSFWWYFKGLFNSNLNVLR
jgi:hypothetical protein